MPTFFDDLYDRFGEMHTEIKKVVDGLPSEALDWVPGEAMNSITVMTVHLLGAETYWMGVAINEPPDRDRDAEFQVKGLSARDLKDRLDSADQFIKRIFAGLTLPYLEEVRHSPRNNKKFSVGWSIIHALEHTALHVGQIQLTRQLWDKKEK